MNIKVERYCNCHKCGDKIILDGPVLQKIQLSYVGQVGDEYYNLNKEVLCKYCSEQFIKWLEE